MIEIRAAADNDASAIINIIFPVIQAGETYALPLDMTQQQALAYWRAPEHDVRVAQEDGKVIGTYYMRPNQKGGGAHVANCGYMTAALAQGKGVARAMCLHSNMPACVDSGAMQFNCVVSTNARAVQLWQRLGFDIAARLPEAFSHPVHGYVDALVMYQRL